MGETCLRTNQTSIDTVNRLISAREKLFNTAVPVTGFELMKAHSNLLDQALSDLFRQSVGEASCTPAECDHVESNLALVATGGYGREELAPCSDVDVSFIAAVDDDPLVAAAVKIAYEAIVEDLSDKLKFKVGYSYRVLGESEGLDLHTRTALLDSRCIAGSTSTVNTFLRELTESMDARFVLEHLRSRQESAGIKPLYSVEPDVKNGTGGLRDVHTAGWIARAVLLCEQSHVWSELAIRGIIPPEELEKLLSGVEFVRRVRNGLHLSAGRQLDSLSVDRREEIAALLEMDVNKLLESYYSAAEDVRAVCERIWSALADKRLPIEKPFALVGRKITLIDRASGLSRPGVALRAFALTQDYEVSISEELAAQITRACQVSPPSLNDTENRFWFRAALDGPAAGSAVVAMAELGILKHLIPEFGKLMHKAPADGSHELTVGAHSLMVVSTLDDMRRKPGSLYGDLWTSVAKPAALYFAALLHDVGKLVDDSEYGHAESGGEIAGSLARKAGFSVNSSDLIQFLVSHHQVMSDVARTHDLTNTAVITEFTKQVGDVGRLRMLFLMSIADVMSVGQASWAEMQCRFLEELYFEVEARLVGDAFAEPERVVNRRRKRLHQDLTLARLPEEIVREHIDVMPPEYLLNEQPENVAGHIEQVISVRKGRPSAAFDEQSGSRITDVTVCAFDRHGLLSQITGTLYALDITVHSARVRTRVSTDAIAIDTLCVDFLGDRLPYFKRKEVEQCLRDALANKCHAEDLIKSRGKAFSPGPDIYSVQLMDAPHYDRTVIEVRAEDVPGLLYFVTAAIARLGWDILSAKITTVGRKAVDAFTVRAQDGGKLPRDAASRLRRELAMGRSDQ